MSSETGEGPRKAIQDLSAAFEKKYPNVTVKVSYRDFTSWIKQVELSLASKNPPDVVAGNQGYQVDGELVKAGLILPLDKYSKAYGWEQSFSPQSLQQFKWTPDGKTFGEGTIYGIAQSGQSTGVFTNMAKLRKAGVDPAQLKSFDDFDAALAKIKATLPADEPVIMLGNKEQFEALHLWGMLQGAYTPAQEVRDWIFHRSGKTFDTPGNRQALREAQGVERQGLPRPRRRLQRPRRDGRREPVRRGKGAFMLAGNWNAQTILDGLGKDAAFFNMPAGPERQGGRDRLGERADPHLLEVQAAGPRGGVHRLHRGQAAGRELVDTTQVPAIVDTTAQPSGQFGKEVAQSWQKLVDDGGLTFFPTGRRRRCSRRWARPSRSSSPGRIAPQDVVCRIQKDWSDYDSELKSGARRGSPRKYARRQARGSAMGATARPGRRRRSRRRRGAAARPGRAARARPGAGRAAARRVPLRGAGVAVLRAVRLRAARLHRLAVVLRLGRDHGRHVGRPGQLPRVLSDPAIRRRSCTRSS